MTSLPQAARIRRMTPADLDRVMEIGENLPEAPHWPRSAYTAAMDAESSPRRIALVVENPAGAKAQALLSGICDPTKVVPLLQNGLSSSTSASSEDVSLLQSMPDVSISATGATDQNLQVVGFAVASLLPPEAELELIAVDPAAQRRGLARRLFARLAEELRATQVNEMILEVRASNLPALALYQSLGFVETGRRKDYYQIPVEDALLMRLGF
jgi:ribosomal-protein-alanine acetyltransferase